MSYDVYCYRAASSVPNVAEAEALVEAINSAEEAGDTKPTSSDTKERITVALIEHNPQLEQYKFDYSKIAGSSKISEREARLRYQHVELNPPDGDLAIQLTVYDDHVFVRFHTGTKAARLIKCSRSYLNTFE